jgi:serine/threonine protein kinase/formylglycine-generating enzyme required for sulfatase activity
MVKQLLSAVEYIHSNKVVHQNLSSEGIFLGAGLELYVGDFGMASYLSDEHTSIHDTTYSLTSGVTYLAPEIKDTPTSTSDVRCDVFSAGLLTIEILSAEPLPKDIHEDFQTIMKQHLDQQAIIQTIGTSTYNVILKAIDPDPAKRWPTIKEFFAALENRLVVDVDSVDTCEVNVITPPVQHTPKPPEPASPETIENIQQSTGQSEGLTPELPPTAKKETWNNRYEIIDKIGGGGQAVVYKALDRLTNEEIAIKTLLARHRKDKSAINRLKQEAMVARSLTHSYIIKTYSVEQRTDESHGGQAVFICMELISSGLELKDAIEKRRAAGKKFSLKEVLHIARQLLNALKYAHEYTIHRDIKPGNIMLVSNNDKTGDDISDLTQFDIRLMDFGIAKVLTRKRIEVTGKGFWSAHYGAPELADSKSTVDVRADLYSVGVIMYQMLTGHIPRKGSPSVNKANKEVSAELAKVIDKAISTDREKRFKSAAVFTKEIERAVSRFSWVWKTAKVAAALMLILLIGIIVKILIPTSERLLVDESISLLENRSPDKTISESPTAAITFSQLEGYDVYNTLRQEALVNLNTLKNAENRDFTSRFPPWKNQERAWLEIEPLIGKTEQIQNDRLEYNQRKDLPVVASLMQLDPSSSILSKISQKIQTAENLFEKRPLSKSVIETCTETYDSAARAYVNIEKLADDPQSPQAAEKINNMLKDVRQLRIQFLSAQNQLNRIEQLQNEDFPRWGSLCLEQADGQYDNFELQTAHQYFSLLSQTCGTLADVKDQVDFESSDISLVVSRIMQLCYENIETFENYPEWKEELRKVHEKKELLAQYSSFQQIISKGPKDLSDDIYDLLVDIRTLHEQGKTKDAKDKLEKLLTKYTEFLNNKVNDLQRNCSSLLTISSTVNEGVIDIENLNNTRISLQQLQEDITASDQLEDNHIAEYNELSVAISTEKDSVKKHLQDKAAPLRENIVRKAILAEQAESFWDSELITNYINIADQYKTDDIAASINNWQKMTNIDRLPTLVKEMENLSTGLDIMLTRKKDLDELEKQISEGISFCELFKGASAKERENQQRWLSSLKDLRKQLAEKQDNTSLIDQEQEVFDSRYKNIYAAVETILNEIPRNSNRVEQIIRQARFLESVATNIDQTLPQWRSIVSQAQVSDSAFQSISMCNELENIKADVDRWDEDRFNAEMLSKCEKLLNTLNRQHRSVMTILRAIKALKVNLDNIMNDADIIELHAISVTNGKVHIINLLQDSLNQHQDILREVELEDSDNEILFSDALLSDFHVSIWLEQCSNARRQMEQRIAQLKKIEETLPPDAATQLAGELPIEKFYYEDLKSAALLTINEHQNVAAVGIGNIENDNQLMQMCDFLEKMESDSIQTPKLLRQTLAAIGNKITNLETLEFDNLKIAKDFNNKRIDISADITSLNENLSRLNASELESACKETISNAPAHFKQLMSQTGQADKINRMSTLLWSFYSKHKDWNQWQSTFRQLFHINIAADGRLRFASLPGLQPVDKNGNDILEGAVSLDPSDFLHIEADNPIDFGWPKYSAANQDPSVRLIFIPSGPGGNEPFYTAAYEINNAQYQLFLSKSGAQAKLKPKGWSRFLDSQDKELVCSTSFDHPPSSIKWDETANTFTIAPGQADVPVTWVTYHGARSYAKWIGAQLPTAAQYEHACRAGSNEQYPWGNDISQISDYAHVRAAGWQFAAIEYNSKIDNPLEIAHPPVGAIKDFRQDENKTLDDSNILHKENTYNSAWPISNANKPNAWGLYDMLGNVWEWCRNETDDTKPVVCGGSCLSPPEYSRPDSKYEFKSRACDVGFRVIVPVR